MQSVIYAIKNLVNNKVYIGSSKSHIKRKYEHFYQLKKGIHHSIHLQRAYDKYGKDKFSFYILEECENNIRKDKEVEYMKQFNSAHRDYGYNIYEPDENGFKCSEATKLKIRNTKTLIPIDLYDTNNVFIKSFECVKDCSIFINCHNSILYDILYKKRKSYKGYTIVLKDQTCNYIKSSKTRDMSKYYK